MAGSITRTPARRQPLRRADANKVRTSHTEEQQRLIKLGETTYCDSVKPMLTETGRSASDSPQVVAGAGFDNAFYSTVIAHHREGLRMIDEIMPRLMNAEVKEIATKMKSDQQREIAAFEKKAK